MAETLEDAPTARQILNSTRGNLSDAAVPRKAKPFLGGWSDPRDTGINVRRNAMMSRVIGGGERAEADPISYDLDYGMPKIVEAPRVQTPVINPATGLVSDEYNLGAMADQSLPTPPVIGRDRLAMAPKAPGTVAAPTEVEGGIIPDDPSTYNVDYGQDAAAPVAAEGGGAREAFSQPPLPTYKDLYAEGLQLAGPTTSWASAIANSNFAKGYAGKQFGSIKANQEQRLKEYEATSLNESKAAELKVRTAAAQAKAAEGDAPSFKVVDAEALPGMPATAQVTMGPHSITMPKADAGIASELYYVGLNAAKKQGMGTLESQKRASQFVETEYAKLIEKRRQEKLAKTGSENG